MNRPTQHQRAMQSLAVTYNRLNSLKQRDPEKYSLSIEHWKTKSRIQLVAAELALNDIPPLRGNLEKLVSEEVDLRTQLLTLDAKRFQARLDKLNAQVERLTGKREEEIERQVELAIRATNRLKPNRKAKARSNRKKKQDRKDSNKTSDKSSSKSKDDKS